MEIFDSGKKKLQKRRTLTSSALSVQIDGRSIEQVERIRRLFSNL